MSGLDSGPLTIERGQPRFSAISAIPFVGSGSNHVDFEGTVGSQGELAIKALGAALRFTCAPTQVGRLK